MAHWKPWLSLYNTYLLGGPLEASDHGVLDLVEVLHGLGGVHQQVGAGALGPEAPDLPGLRGVPLELVHEEAAALLDVLARRDVAL